MKLSDEIYVGYLVAQISDDEQRAFDVPSHSADLTGWDLLRIKDKLVSVRTPPSSLTRTPHWLDLCVLRIFLLLMKQKRIQNENRMSLRKIG